MSESSSGTATEPAAQARGQAGAGSDSTLRRLVVLVVSIALSIIVFRAVVPFMESERGVVGPLVADASSPVWAALAVVLAVVVCTAISALVGKLVNSVVGLFVLGAGIGYLAMRSGSSSDFCFGGSSVLAAAAELVVWTVLVAAGSHVVFKVGGPLPDLPPTYEDDVDSPTGRSARLAWLAGIAGVAAAWLAAATATKGQAIGAAALAGFATGAVGRMLAPSTAPVYLAAAPVLAFAAVFAFLGFSGPSDLSTPFVDGSLPRLLRLMPCDIAAGALCGTSIGFGFMRSFAPPSRG